MDKWEMLGNIPSHRLEQNVCILEWNSKWSYVSNRKKSNLIPYIGASEEDFLSYPLIQILFLLLRLVKQTRANTVLIILFYFT